MSYYESDDNTAMKMAKLAVDKSLLKEYSTKESKRTVYLKDNDNFQIQLFNPTNQKVGAEIYLNGQMLDGIVVLKPGERIWLERYLTENAKFVFKTYTVDGDDDDVQKAIQNNGNVLIKFYYEEKPTYNYFQPTIYYNYNNCEVKARKPRCRNINMPLSSTSNSCDQLYMSQLNTITCDAQLSASADSCLCNLKTSANSIDCDSTLSLSNIETGRIDKGGYSNQELNKVNASFETWPFLSTEFKILPMSMKPVGASDIQKQYCTECGRKINPKFKFCPFCGAKVE